MTLLDEVFAVFPTVSPYCKRDEVLAWALICPPCPILDEIPLKRFEPDICPGEEVVLLEPITREPVCSLSLWDSSYPPYGETGLTVVGLDDHLGC